MVVIRQIHSPYCAGPAPVSPVRARCGMGDSGTNGPTVGPSGGYTVNARMVRRSDVAVAADDRRIVSRPLAWGQARETAMWRPRVFAASVFPWALVRRLARPVAPAAARCGR